MTGAPLRRRRGGPILGTAVDLVRHARHTRRWALLIIVVLVAVAVIAGSAGQAAVPFLVYGGL